MPTEEAEAALPKPPHGGSAESHWQKIVAWLNCIWEVFQDLGEVLALCRFSVIVVLLAGLALALTDQGLHLLVIAAEDSAEAVSLMTFVWLWAYSAWYWARAILTHGAAIPTKSHCDKPIFGCRVRRVRLFVRYTPRLIGTAAFAMILWGQWRASTESPDLSSATLAELSDQMLWVAAEAAVFFLIVAIRRPTSKLLNKLLASTKLGRLALLELEDEPPYRLAESLRDLPVNVQLHALVFGGGWVVFFIMAIADPTLLGRHGAIASFMIGAATWTAFGTAILYWFSYGRFPVFTLLIVLAIGFSFINDNHDVRTLGGDRATVVDRLDLKEVYRTWQEAHEGSPQPLVLVATAGGGSRAAYWTATVLGALRAGHSDFDGALFGISGVSGGSLGAVVYRALATKAESSGLSCGSPGADQALRTFDACAQSILAGEFLGAAVTALLYPDLVQRFLPLGFLPDRGKALELAWERSWSQTLGKADESGNPLAGDFLSLWPDRGDPAQRWPALFLNGTSVATGRRIVTSNLDVSSSLSDGLDFFDHWDLPIRASTAVNNSARFPGIGAAGTLRRDPTSDDPNTLDRIVDGGYFENFGAATAQDLLQALARESCPDQTAPCAFKPVIIQISSDPDYRGVVRKAGDPNGDGAEREPASEASPGSYATEVRSPIKALLKTRSSRGVLAAQQLYDWTIDRGGLFYEFRLIRQRDSGDPPLGWALSGAAQRNMNCQLGFRQNRKQLASLAAGSGLLGFDLEAALAHSKAVCEGSG